MSAFDTNQQATPEASKFKQSIREFDELSDAIKTAKEQLKVLNTRKKQLEQVIIIFMDRNKVKKAVTKKKEIIHRETTRQSPVTKKEMPNIFVQFFTQYNQDSFIRKSPIEKATEIQDFVKSKGKSTTSHTLSCRKKKGT